MKYKPGSAAHAIRRQQKHIEDGIKAGKSRNAIRRELINSRKIPQVSHSHFNLTVSDFDLLVATDNQANDVGQQQKGQPTDTPLPGASETTTRRSSDVAVRPVDRERTYFDAPMADPRFPTSFEGEAK